MHALGLGAFSFTRLTQLRNHVEKLQLEIFDRNYINRVSIASLIPTVPRAKISVVPNSKLGLVLHGCPGNNGNVLICDVPIIIETREQPVVRASSTSRIFLYLKYELLSFGKPVSGSMIWDDVQGPDQFHELRAEVAGPPQTTQSSFCCGEVRMQVVKGTEHGNFQNKFNILHPLWDFDPCS
jgi:hypothetical protein